MTSTLASPVGAQLRRRRIPHKGAIAMLLVPFGILFALFCRVLVRATARRRARAAERRLRAAISDVAGELVLTPVRDVLAGYDTARKGVDQALG